MARVGVRKGTSIIKVKGEEKQTSDYPHKPL